MAAQSGTREINRKAIGFAEKNVNAAFDFAQQLVRAKDPKEIVQLQQEFLKRQVEQMSGQMKELGEQATQTAQRRAPPRGRRPDRVLRFAGPGGGVEPARTSATTSAWPQSVA